ncbi:DUF6176 family protein [Jeotgalicoccus huakuii]|uniref:DUF6176 family protein n=1 Tax=Jeotgalicoccus TaxID=227979 RepID=UPI000428C906|nr:MULTISPECIES: DUF6176 family protein [Jeotgalicoccus]MCK1976434.1 DUF6176 family protein [Jeotgalicoccus huakuii]QQD84391.1 hypothetical protein JEM45_07020 [Jeotgalicoccus sp. ATCC 8456]
MRAELTKFKVKEGKSEIVDEWIKYMQENMDDVLMNLEGEKMYVETIFREVFMDVEYLYWYSIQADDGEKISDADIDEKHLEYMDACIDKTFRPADMQAEVIMLPDHIRQLIR